MFAGMDNFLDVCIEKFKPALAETSDTVRAYVDRICERLDNIADAVAQDETFNVRRNFPVTLSAATPIVEVFQVPTDQDWRLETVTVDTDAAASVRITDGNNSIPLWGITIAGASVQTLTGGGVFLSGGTVITLNSSAGNQKVRLQIRFERKKAKHNARTAGQINRTPDRKDSRNEAAETARHAGTAQWAGNNVIGERHVSQPI